jgi:hypothetical protein
MKVVFLITSAIAPHLPAKLKEIKVIEETAHLPDIGETVIIDNIQYKVSERVFVFDKENYVKLMLVKKLLV